MPPNIEDLQGHHEINKLLTENQRLLIENNTLLRKMRRDQIYARILRLIWLAAILGLSYYSYVKYIEPNMTMLQEQMVIIQSLVPDSDMMKNFYESFGRGQ